MTNGHCLVNVDQLADIGSFVSTLLSNYKGFQTEPKASSLTTERINKFNKLGFVWNASHENAWRIVKNMEANGEERTTVEELEHQPSSHPLKCLTIDLSYKTYLVWRTVKNMEANGKELPTMEELEHQPSKHPLKCLVTNLGYANKLKK